MVMSSAGPAGQSVEMGLTTVPLEKAMVLGAGSNSFCKDPTILVSRLHDALVALLEAAASAKLCKLMCRDIVALVAAKVPMLCMLVSISSVPENVSSHFTDQLVYNWIATVNCVSEATFAIYAYIDSGRRQNALQTAEIIEEEIWKHRCLLLSRLRRMVACSKLASNVSATAKDRATATAVKRAFSNLSALQFYQPSWNPDAVVALARAEVSKREAVKLRQSVHGQKVHVSDSLGPVYVEMSPDGQWLAATCKNCRRGIAVFSAESGVLAYRIRAPRTQNFAAWSPDSATVVVDCGTAVQVWDVVHQKLFCYLDGAHEASVVVAEWNPNGTFLATGDSDGTVVLWRVSAGSGKNLVFVRGAETHGAVSCVSWVFGGTTVAITRQGCASVSFWSLAGEAVGEMQGSSTASLQAVSWNPTGSKIATGAEDGTVQVWEIAQHGKRVVGMCSRELQVGCCVDAVTWSPDGSMLALALFAVGSEVWDVVAGVRRSVLTRSFFGAWCVKWSSHRQLVLTGCLGSVYLHDVSDCFSS